MASPAPLPSITGTSTRPISILLINPNSTPSMTTACLRSLAPTLPPHVTVTGFTAPHPSPSAIEGTFDGVLSAAASLRAILPIAPAYDAFLVACFSAHPLIPALREELIAPVIGIMEAALYAARMLGSRLGVVATAARSKVMHEDAIAHYGLGKWSAGAVSTGLGVLELERKPKEEVLGLMEKAARELVFTKGADVIALGCAGMTEMRDRCEAAVGEGGHARVVDGVGLGVHFLVALVREGQLTAKGGAYKSSAEGRKARGQDWV